MKKDMNNIQINMWYQIPIPIPIPSYKTIEISEEELLKQAEELYQKEQVKPRPTIPRSKPQLTI